MTMCGGLATIPSQQGKGYGGQLIDFITGKVRQCLVFPISIAAETLSQADAEGQIGRAHV